jgi:hypothetical protein
MLIHEFIQRWTQLFSYLDSGYFHQKTELPPVQKKSEQILFVQLKRIITSSETNMTVCHLHYAKSEE